MERKGNCNMIGNSTGWDDTRHRHYRAPQRDSRPRHAAAGAATVRTIDAPQPSYGPTRRDRMVPALALIATQLFVAAVFWLLLPMTG